jgi:hypothetical protein
VERWTLAASQGVRKYDSGGELIMQIHEKNYEISYVDD